jgi:hypothetical protein
MTAAVSGLGTASGIPAARPAGSAGRLTFSRSDGGGDREQFFQFLTAAASTGQGINLGLRRDPKFRFLSAFLAFVFVDRHSFSFFYTG